MHEKLLRARLNSFSFGRASRGLALLPLAMFAFACSGDGVADESDAPATSNDAIATTQQALGGARLAMYELYAPSTTDHFYTTSAAHRDLAKSYGYSDLGVPFYVEASQTDGAQPFRRFYKGSPQTDHFYTTASSEVSYVLANGWVAEGNEGYIYPTPPAGTVALYRLNRFVGETSDLDHQYTTNWYRMQALRGDGWSYDGIVGYVWAEPAPPQVVAQDDPLEITYSSTFPKDVIVTNTRTGTKNTYPRLVDCNTIVGNTSSDLNGRVGREVVLHTGCGTHYAIDDANRRTYSWAASPATWKRSFGIADLDRARPGKELVSLSNTATYTSNWSLVYEADIDYVRLSPDTSAVSVVRTRVSGNPSIFATNEFDGADGDELALLDGFTLSFYRGTQSGLSKYRTASFQSANSTFYDVGDTNNVPGREIVVAQDLVYNLALGTSQSRAVVVFSPATGTTRSYSIGSGVMKTSFKDRDGQPGVEICFTTQQSTWLGTTKIGYMIVDRLSTWYQSSACL